MTMMSLRAYTAIVRQGAKTGRVTVRAANQAQAMRMLKHGGVEFVRWAEPSQADTQR